MQRVEDSLAAAAQLLLLLFWGAIFTSNFVAQRSPLLPWKLENRCVCIKGGGILVHSMSLIICDEIGFHRQQVWERRKKKIFSPKKSKKERIFCHPMMMEQ